MAVTQPLAAQLRASFLLPHEHSRRRAVLELLPALELAPKSAGAEIEALLQGMRQEASSLVLSSIWGYLADRPNAALRRFAEQELGSADAQRRSYAVYYLGHAYPEERRGLFERMKSDPDPAVLHEVGRLVMDEDPRAAVTVWRRAMYDAPAGLADEVLAPLVGQYADAPTLAELRREAENPNDELARIALWRAGDWTKLDYLDARGDVAPGPGYCFPCPECGKTLCVREGHEWERARCRQCGGSFTIPPRDST